MRNRCRGGCDKPSAADAISSKSALILLTLALRLTCSLGTWHELYYRQSVLGAPEGVPLRSLISTSHASVQVTEASVMKLVAAPAVEPSERHDAWEARGSPVDRATRRTSSAPRTGGSSDPRRERAVAKTLMQSSPAGVATAMTNQRRQERARRHSEQTSPSVWRHHTKTSVEWRTSRRGPHPATRAAYIGDASGGAMHLHQDGDGSRSSQQRRAQASVRHERSTGDDDGGRSNGKSDGEDAATDDGSREQEESASSSDGEDLLIIILCVVGVGVFILVVLCCVRKVMDLCMLRNDPSGRLRYSQEEGLPKSAVERLPLTRYKKPGGRAQSKAGRVNKAKQQGEAVVAVPLPQSIPAAERRPHALSAVEQASEATATAGAGGNEEERDSTEDMCAICLVEYEHGDELRVIPGCKHHFHRECIDPWLETKAMCAYCKAKVEPRRSCCDRISRSAADRLGLHLVAPTTIRFSSSRRTYTNEDVQMATGPTLPQSYGRSDVDYVGSMVARIPLQGDVETGDAGNVSGGGNPPADGSSTSRRVADGQGETRGAVIVQPVSSPSFFVVSRERSSGEAADSSSANEIVGARGGGAAAEEKTNTPVTMTNTRRVDRHPPRGGSRGVRDGYGGVVFGGNTEEFKEAEAEERVRQAARAGSGQSREVQS